MQSEIPETALPVVTGRTGDFRTSADDMMKRLGLTTKSFGGGQAERRLPADQLRVRHHLRCASGLSAQVGRSGTQ